MKVLPSVTVDECIDDESVPCFQPLIDVHYVEWRTEVSNELLKVPHECGGDDTTNQKDEGEKVFLSLFFCLFNPLQSND